MLALSASTQFTQARERRLTGNRFPLHRSVGVESNETCLDEWCTRYIWNLLVGEPKTRRNVHLTCEGLSHNIRLKNRVDGSCYSHADSSCGGAEFPCLRLSCVRLGDCRIRNSVSVETAVTQTKAKQADSECELVALLVLRKRQPLGEAYELTIRREGSAGWYSAATLGSG